MTATATKPSSSSSSKQRPGRTLKLTSPLMQGHDVERLQRFVNDELAYWHVPKQVKVDGEYGPATRAMLETVLYGMGVARSSIELGVTPALRGRLYRKNLTPAEVKRAHARAAWRRRLVHRYTGHGPAAAIAYARKQVGTIEHPAGTNRGPKIDDWERACGVFAAPWCGCFANACLVAAGFPSQPFLRYCPSIEAIAKSGQNGWSWHPISAAKPGDLVLYGAAIAQHVGLYIGNGVTIEGNTSSGNAGSQDNGGGVFIRRRDFHAAGFPARGVARPPYSKHR